MPINLNLNIFKSGGQPHTVKIFEFKPESAFDVPDGAMILYAEHIPDGDHVEVWAAVPNSSIITSTSGPLNQSMASPYRAPEIFKPNEAPEGSPVPEEIPVSDIITEEDEDGTEVVFLDYGGYGIDE